VQVTGENFSGWVAGPLIVTLHSDLPLAFTADGESAHLRDRPWGAVLSTLPPGTPVQILETAQVDGLSWAHVILPDERGGWVALPLLVLPESNP
jgi:hypothetical protein